jgi:hypothetical protein
MSMTLMQASRQWASRPDDERFTSLTALNDYCHASRNNSQGIVVSSRKLSAAPLDGDNEYKSLVVLGPNGNPVAPTHWSFGQLAQRAGAPAGYLRDLPSPIAADCINYGLKHMRSVEDIGVLLYKNGGAPELRAVTGPNYGRIWNADMTQALVNRFGDGVSGDWRVPGEFGKAVAVTKQNTTLYASDRDMFVFLADEKNRIEMRNRRNGSSGSLARGFFVWNSEVGKSTYGFAMFLFDYTCSNRIVWGVEEYREVRGRHTSSAPDRWLEEVQPMLLGYAEASANPIEQAIAAAQQKRIDDVADFMRKRFTQTQANAMMQLHVVEEGRPIESLWDATTAITAYARNVPHQDARVELEREAGKVMDLVI